MSGRSRRIRKRSLEKSEEEVRPDGALEVKALCSDIIRVAKQVTELDERQERLRKKIVNELRKIHSGLDEAKAERVALQEKVQVLKQELERSLDQSEKIAQTNNLLRKQLEERKKIERLESIREIRSSDSSYRAIQVIIAILTFVAAAAAILISLS